MIYVKTGNEATFQALYKPSHANSKDEKPGQAILGGSGGVFCEVDYLPLVWAVDTFICTKKQMENEKLHSIMQLIMRVKGII